MLDSREVRQAVEFYNRAQEDGTQTSELDYPPIKVLENVLEEVILKSRELSNLLDEADKLWNLGDVKNVVNQAATNEDYPADSAYPKRWWKTIIMPQVDALKVFFATVPTDGKSPNEIIYDRPPKQKQSAITTPTP